MKLKLERVKRNLTQTDLANAAGVSVSMIVKLEKGYEDNATLYILKKVSKALDMSVSDLFL